MAHIQLMLSISPSSHTTKVVMVTTAASKFRDGVQISTQDQVITTVITTTPIMAPVVVNTTTEISNKS
jgi:hypothetical protein